MKYEQVEKLIDAVSKSDLTEFKFEEGGIKLSLKKEEKTVIMEGPQAVNYGVAANGTESQTSNTAENTGVQDTTSQAAGVPAAGQLVTSPLVGVFYSAPSEDADAFVSVGDEVKVGQVLAIVEAMKLMNEIDSEVAGIVTEVLVQNGDAVEYGQPLFRIA